MIHTNNTSKHTQLRVLLAEDEALVRQGLAALLETEDCVITQVSDGASALKALISNEYDIALIDIGLPVRTGLDVLRKIRQRELPLKVIILTGDTNTYTKAAIMEMGADAFIYKTAYAEEFLNTFITVAKGRRVRTRGPKNESETAPNKNVAEIHESMTARELQVIKLIVEGHDTIQIANILCISKHTVRKHREHVNRKLVDNTPSALAVFAIKAKLV